MARGAGAQEQMGAGEGVACVMNAAANKEIGAQLQSLGGGGCSVYTEVEGIQASRLAVA